MKGTAKDIYNKYKGNDVKYKNTGKYILAGYCEHYLILGFTDNTGCIKEFTNNATLEYECMSYRFAKPKHVTLINKC